MQAVETAKALSELDSNISVELFNWSERYTLPDLFHFVSYGPQFHKITELIRQAGKPYVITMLMGNPDPITQWTAATKRFVKSNVLRQKGRDKALAGASAIVAITEIDVAAMRAIFGIKHAHIVPNGVDQQFFDSSPEVWHREFGDAPFILCVGAIQFRKNQLLLLEAANRAGLPVVLLGPILPGQKEYAQKVAVAAEQNAKFGGRWLQNLRNEDALLISAYAACRFYALLSSEETQPLSVMQAMAARKPVLLFKAPYTRDLLFRNLPSLDSTQLDQVAETLKRIWNEGVPSMLSSDYTWGGAALRLEKIYRDILKTSPGLPSKKL